MRLVDPDRWQPLPTPEGLGQRFLAPHWGLVAPFALATGWELRPSGPRRHPGRSFLLQAQELLDDSAGLDDETKAIAEHWADGPASETPPGHWCLLAQQVSARYGHDLDDDVKLFLALSAALLDAGIACWDAKRAYDSARPITAIRYLCRPGGAGPGRPWAGRPADQGRGLAALHRHPAVPRVRLGARGTRPSARPRPSCWPGAPGRTASGPA
jgi:hypothetical protein